MLEASPCELDCSARARPSAAQAGAALRLEEGVPPLTRLLRSTEPLLRALEQETGAASPCDFGNALAGIGPQAAPAVARARGLLGEMAATCEEARVRRQAAH